MVEKIEKIARDIFDVNNIKISKEFISKNNIKIINLKNCEYKLHIDKNLDLKTIYKIKLFLEHSITKEIELKEINNKYNLIKEHTQDIIYSVEKFTDKEIHDKSSFDFLEDNLKYALLLNDKTIINKGLTEFTVIPSVLRLNKKREFESFVKSGELFGCSTEHYKIIILSNKLIDSTTKRIIKLRLLIINRIYEKDQLIRKLNKTNKNLSEEINKRFEAEQKLKEHYHKLEEMVKERTAELNKTNKQLILEISERKQSEEALQESEKRFRDIADSMADWIWEVDAEGRYTYCSGKVEAILGFTKEEIVGKTPFDFMAPEEIDRVSEIFGNISAKKKQIKNLENWNIRKDGQRVCLLTNGVPILNEKGELLGYRGVDNDITKRKQTEERIRFLSSVVEQSADGMAIADMKGKLLFVNDVWVNMHGYENAEELFGKNLSVFHNKEQLKYDVEPFHRKVTEKGHCTGEVGHIRKDGTIFPTQMTTTILKDENNNPIAVAGVATDITKRKQAEEALKNSEEQFRMIAENTSDVISLHSFDLKATYTYVSPSVKAISGYEPEEMIGKSCFDFIHPDDKKNVLFPMLKKYLNKKIKKILIGKESDISITIEYRVKNKQGNWRYAQSTGNIVGNQLLFVSRDITEHKKAEEMLRESESLLRQVINTSPNCIYVKDREGRYVLVNRRMADMHNTASEDLIGVTDLFLAEKWLTDDAEIKKFRAAELKVIDKKQVRFIPEEEFMYRDGTKRWFQTTKSPIIMKNKPDYLMSVSVDITEHKQAEEKEKEHIKNISLLSESAMQFVELAPDKNIYNYIGEKLREFVGEKSYIIINSVDTEKNILTTRSLIGAGKFLSKIIKHTGQDPVGMIYDLTNETLKYLSDGKIHYYEEGLYGIALKKISAPICKAIEKIGNIEKIYTVGFTKENKLFGTAVIFLPNDAEALKSSDIIETFIKQASLAVQRSLAEEALKESEKQLQTLIDAMPDFVCFKDGDGRWLKANDAGIRIFRLKGTDYQGKTDSELAELNSMLRGTFLTCRDTDARAWKESGLIHGEETITDPAGSVRVFDVAKVPVYYTDGKRKGIVVLGHDITKRKQAEEELKKHREHLEELVKERTSEVEDKANKIEDSQKAMRYLLEDVNDARKELLEANKKITETNKDLESFSYSVSHDLKSPLRAINGYTGVLIEDYPDLFTDEPKELMDNIIKNSNKMNKLIDDLLRFSRAGRTELNISEFNLSLMVKDVINAVKENYKDKNIKSKIQKDVLIDADIAAIKQVLFNLIGNAVKFSKDKEIPEIEFGTKYIDDNNVYFIKDNGIGFNMKYTDKLFDVFQRLHSSEKYEGTGVGLALVKRIIQKQGGKIWAESEIGKGSAFYFTIP